MKTKIKWRLGELPTPEEVTDLVKAEILTKEEAREILISLETDEERDKKSLQGEIKFLRELVEKLSNNRKTEIIRQIEYIEKPYYRQPWYEPYKLYCTTGLATSGGTSSLTVSGTNGVYTTSASSNNLLLNGTSNTAALSVAPAFTNIKTF